MANEHNSKYVPISLPIKNANGQKETFKVYRPQSKYMLHHAYGSRHVNPTGSAVLIGFTLLGEILFWSIKNSTDAICKAIRNQPDRRNSTVSNAETMDFDQDQETPSQPQATVELDMEADDGFTTTVNSLTE